MNARLNGTGLRRSDWPLLLEVYVERHRDTAFAWGRHDCVTFAIGWLELAREDLAPREELAGQLDYASAFGALRSLDGRELLQAVNDWGRLTEVAPRFAQRGDIVLVSCEERLCLGACVGDHAAAPGAAGLVLVPMSAACAAWKV